MLKPERFRDRRLHALLAASLWLAACSTSTDIANTQAATSSPAPGWPHGAMVSAANPAAVDAAIGVLERGGHAVDAAIAAHVVLGLVEPESSGIGGSAFMLVHDRASGRTVVFDGRETAPGGARADMLTKNGEPQDFRSLWPQGVTVGVPGAVSVYEAAHREFGRADWADLFTPAIRLATDGFTVSEKFVRYNEMLRPVIESGAFPDAAAYLFPEGVPVAAGDTKVNPAYAETLRRIVADGAAGFYTGTLAAAIVARARQAPAASSMTLDDMAAYETMPRAPVCGTFRRSTICSVPPPSSGLAQIMIPALYDEMQTDEDASLDEKLVVFVDAQRLAYADRDHFVGDPDFADVPVENLIDADYIRHRATERFAPADTPTHGDPFFVTELDKAAWLRGTDRTMEAAGTTHLSIIDRDGNAVSMTASVGFPYGSVRMTNGFFLNNELTDFSQAPTAGAAPAVNAVAPRKRPRSSMSPTIVFDANGDPLMLTGSAGGSSIVAYTAKTVLGVFDWGLSAQSAVDFPNIVARGAAVGVEVSASGGQAIADDLTERGYAVSEGRGENSGLHVIVVRADGMEGAADSRRHGTVKAIPAAPK